MVMKNCDPLVSLPALAIDKRPGSVCFLQEGKGVFEEKKGSGEKVSMGKGMKKLRHAVHKHDK